MDRTEFNNVVTALIADVRTRTGLPASLEIDDTYDGDLPMLTLEYRGLTAITLFPNKSFKNAEFTFALILKSRMANGGQLSNVLYAETQIAKTIPESVNGTSDEPNFSLTISGYEVKYSIAWNTQTRTNEDEYTR